MHSSFPLVCQARACPIDQNVTHRDRGEREKMGAIAPGNTGLIDQLEVRLMY